MDKVVKFLNWNEKHYYALPLFMIMYLIVRS